MLSLSFWYRLKDAKRMGPEQPYASSFDLYIIFMFCYFMPHEWLPCVLFNSKTGVFPIFFPFTKAQIYLPTETYIYICFTPKNVPSFTNMI